MSNQEMQFADPDWKPSQQLDPKNNQQEQEAYTPQPINNEYREQNTWGSAPPATSQQQEGYTGLHPYNSPVPGQMQSGMYRQRAYRRRGRGMWFWIILAFIIFSLISGGSRFGNRFGVGNDSGFDHSSISQGPVMGQTYNYTVNGQATIVINDPNGNVTVTENPSNTSTVSIQTIPDKGPFGNSSSIQPDISKQGNSITANIKDNQQGPIDLNVTVPENANLTLTTDSGSINFAGTFGTSGTSNFNTTSGDIILNVMDPSTFQVDALTNSGSIDTDFQNLNVKDNTSGSGQNLNGVVGGSSEGQLAKIVARSDSGSISLYQK